jgi:lipoprotein-releasing system permease protein
VNKEYNWSFLKKHLVSGQIIDFKDSVEAQKQILISEQTANRLKLNVGDDFLMYFVQEPIRRRKFNVVGIFNVGVEEVDKTYVVGDLSIIRRLNNWDINQVGGYELRTVNFENLTKTEGEVNDFLPSQLRSYTIKDYYPQIFEWLGLLDVNAQVMLLLMMAVAVINMISALLIMILERTSMIGMLKALGATNWNIQKIFLYNAMYLIGLGLLLGNLFGLGISYFQHQTHFFKLDQASYYMNFVPVKINFTDILFLNIGVLMVCMFVLLIPSMLVAKISPVKAIRFK